MGNDEIAKRIAQGELRNLANKMFTQANDAATPGTCPHHQELTRAVGCLLIGMDELLNNGRRGFMGLLAGGLAVIGSVAAGVAFAIAKIIGFGAPGK